MIKRFQSLPIRVYLMILVALVAVPAISLIVYSGINERREAIDGAKADCLKFVNEVAGQHQALGAGAEQLATALSTLPQIHSRNPAAASALFSDLVKKNPQYTNIAVCDKSGIIWASGLPFTGKPSVASRRFFLEAIRTGNFSSGEYSIGSVAKRPTFGLGYPVKNSAHEVIAVIGVILDLNYSQQLFEKLHLPPNSSFSLLDHQGVILIRNLNLASSKELIGVRDTRQENFTKMTDPDEGTFEAKANDGLYRLAAYKKIYLAHESKPYMYIRASIPLASATSKANAAMLKNLSIFVSLFLIGLILAWFIGERVIVKPVMLLKKASEQLAGGTETVNVSQAVKGGELGDLARTFDSMAEALVQRETAQHAAEAALRESEQRWATTLASVGDAVIATDVEGKITFMNATAEALTGWIIDEAAMKPAAEVFNIVNEQTRKQVESPITKVLREGMVVGLANHTILVRKDGTEVPIDDSGAPIKDREGKTLGVVLVFRDITERKLDEERIRHLASFPQLNPNPIIEVDASGKIIFFNPVTQTILDSLGLEEKDVTAFLPEDMDSILGNSGNKDESIFSREVVMAGRVFDEVIHLVPQFNVARIYTRDVTEAKRAEEVLKTTQQRFYVVLSSLYSAVLLVTDEGLVEFANQAFCDRFGLKEAPADLAGLSSGDMIEKIKNAYLDPDEAVARIREIVDRGQSVKVEEVAMKNGDTCLRDYVPLNVGGKSYGRLWVHFDITERKRAEEVLRQSHEELEFRVKERTQELSMTNEELNTTIEECHRVELELRQSESRLKHLSNELLTAQENERRSVAREIHDSIGSSLAAVKFKMEAVTQEVGRDRPNATAALQSITPLIQTAIEETRRMQMNLRPPMLDDIGLLSTIAWFCRQFETIYPQIGVRQDIQIKEDQIPVGLKTVIFRVMQEAMNNAAKYSKADVVFLFLKKTSRALELTIRDTGGGFDLGEVRSREGAHRGLGLDSMGERVELSDGSFSIESSKRGGTVIRASWLI